MTTVPESLGFLDGQIAFLQDREYELVAISSPGSLLHEFGARNGIDVIAVPMKRAPSPIQDLKSLAKLTRELRRLRPTIVHAHTPKAGLLGVLAGLLAGTPVRIYHMRGLPFLTARGGRRALLRAIEKITCTVAHRVISVSPSLRGAALREGLCRPEKIVVLANGSGQGVDASHKFDPDRVGQDARSRVRERLGIPEDALVIGFLGRLAREKGVAELVQAFVRLADQYPRLHLLVAGERDARDAADEQALARLASDPRIHVIGHDWNTPPLYAAMDIVALPTYREGFPNVPLEASAMQRPVVATRVEGCVDAVADETTGLLVPPRDAAALADALERYIVDRVLAARHGGAGRQRVLDKFRREQIWHALDRFYMETLGVPRTTVYSAMKRATDIGVAAMALGVLAVPMLAIGTAVAVNMGRPAVFSQERPGRGERLFRMFKFRTMTNERDAAGELLPDSMRITKLGTFLRRTSLDELPELFNVLRGDMSLVGPRPLLVRYLPHFTRLERLRHSVRPGITGWAQVHGRNLVSWDERIALDVWYVLNRSLSIDLKVLLSTLKLVLRREGVVVDPHSVMLNFDEERIARAAKESGG